MELPKLQYYTYAYADDSIVRFRGTLSIMRKLMMIIYKVVVWRQALKSISNGKKLTISSLRLDGCHEYYIYRRPMDIG